ncbi:MAG: hypothetical protein IT158_23265 [Bryobacterales bacterium]|nr:hypothetical protein [Bryobacterales bacterium]
MLREELSEYTRGYQDALNKRGYDDGSTNTQGFLTVLGLTPRRYALAYAEGYRDALDHRGLELEQAVSPA